MNPGRSSSEEPALLRRGDAVAVGPDTVGPQAGCFTNCRALFGPLQFRFLFALLAWGLSLAALDASEFHVRHWSTEDGLPDGDVYQLIQDRNGYLWTAARSGVSRFDGTAFKSTEPPGPRDFFVGFLEDADGSLLLAPRSGDPLRYRNGIWRPEPLPAPHTGQAIGSMLRAPDGAIWYSIRGAVLRLAAGQLETFGSTDGIAPYSWTRFAVDAAGRVWLASDQMLARYEAGGIRRVSFDANGAELRVASARRDGPWVIAGNHIMKLDANDGIVPVATVAPLLGAHYLNAAVEDRHGRLWLATRSQGVHLVSNGRAVQVATPSDAVNALIEDGDGILWVGATGGLSAIAPKVHTLLEKSSGLMATGVTAICEDLAGDIWVANGDGGVARFRNGRFEPWPLRHESRAFGSMSVAAHPDGGIWSVGNSAVFRVTGEPGGVSVVSHVGSSGPQPACLTTTTGDFWLSTGERRVGRLRGNTYQTFGTEHGLSSAGVRCFSQTRDGELLVGTNDGALLRFEGERFVPARADLVNLGTPINAILAKGGDYWLGTSGRGILVTAGDRVASVGAPQGLPDENVMHMASDEHGYVWCGTGSGVFRVREDDVDQVARGQRNALSTLRLGRDEGLPGIACRSVYGPGALKSRDGRVWMAARQGVLVIDPAAEALASRPPRVAVEEVRVDEQVQPVTGRIRVMPAVRKIEIRFSVLSLAAPSRVKIRYRLIGFDSEWVEGDGRRTAAYPRLPAGEYRFEVAAEAGDRSAAPSIDAVGFVVPLRWWQTLWFQLPASVAALAAIAGVVRMQSHRRLRRRIEKLERESVVARERARIAQNIHDDVGASLTRISLLTQAGAPQSSDSENLNRIYETAREITRSLDEIVWAVNPQYDTLESFVSYLTDFAQKFLGLASIRCRLDIPADLPGLPLSSELRHHLFLCCREAINNVVKHSGASEASIRVTMNAPLLVIMIADNGRGHSAPSANASADRVMSGHGLENLRQRMQQVGGSCTIECRPGGGTSVTLAVKIENQRTLSA